MNIKPKCTATAIGSMPFADPDQALDIVFDSISSAPAWPQLSKRGLHEQMEVQFSEGLPRIVVDESKGRMYFDTTGDYSEELASFYEGFLLAEEEGDCSSAAISADFSAGLPAFLERIKGQGGKRPFVKGQTTGPISFALTIVDENKRAIYYNDEFVDTVVKSTVMKCRWQVQQLKPHADSVICYGAARVVEDLEERTAILTAFNRSFRPGAEAIPPNQAAGCAAIEIVVTEMTGRRERERELTCWRYRLSE